MNIINFETLLVTIFVLVDDWCLTQKTASSNHSPGVQPSMNDSEIITLALMMDYLPFPGETQFLAFIKANYHQWFPHLLTQSQFNRRLRKLAFTIAQRQAMPDRKVTTFMGCKIRMHQWG